MKNSLTFLLLILMSSVGQKLYAQTLEFRFANPQVVTGGTSDTFQIDIQIQTSTSNLFHEATLVYVNYNTTAFGTSIQTNGKIRAQRIGIMSEKDAFNIGFKNDLVVNDNTTSRVAFATTTAWPNQSPGSNFHSLYPTSWATYLRLHIAIASTSANSGMSFDSTLMAGEQYIHDASGSFVAFANIGFDQSQNTNNTPLPVELISFNVSKEANDAMLSWATASEKDNSHFEVERSTDGRQWTTVGTVNGHGTSTARHNYTFADQNVYNGRGTQTFYYRLRQVDYNGAHDYSDVRVVTFTGEGRVAVVSLSPNPTTDRVQVSITGYTGRFTATFIDGNGRTAGVYEGSGSQLVVPVTRFKGGTYTVRVTTPAGEVLGTQRLVVVR